MINIFYKMVPTQKVLKHSEKCLGPSMQISQFTTTACSKLISERAVRIKMASNSIVYYLGLMHALYKYVNGQWRF